MKIIVDMVVNLHFQFAKKEPQTLALDIGKAEPGQTVWLEKKDRRKIRELYKKVFHRSIEDNVFTFHVGKTRPKGSLDGPLKRFVYAGENVAHRTTFNYDSRERYRLIVPPGNRKHLWTNGRRSRIFRHWQMRP